jgi:glycosyltransferase involved in cell wall biosynthesis
MSALAGLSVVLPCFNEEGIVERAVDRAADAAAAAADDYEVIVVDDASTDATLPVASEVARRDRRVRVLVHAAHRGYGAAVRTGIGAARMPWILLVDAGLPIDPHELQGFLPVAAHADLVVGRRALRGDPFTRRVGAAAWNGLMRHIFSVPLHDVDCTFKLARRAVVEPLPLSSDGTMIGTELVVRTLTAGGRVREVRVRHEPRNARTHGRASRRGQARRRLPAR